MIHFPILKKRLIEKKKNLVLNEVLANVKKLFYILNEVYYNFLIISQIFSRNDSNFHIIQIDHYFS